MFNVVEIDTRSTIINSIDVISKFLYSNRYKCEKQKLACKNELISYFLFVPFIYLYLPFFPILLFQLYLFNDYYAYLRPANYIVWITLSWESGKQQKQLLSSLIFFLVEFQNTLSKMQLKTETFDARVPYNLKF